jgi:hypothetical protein
MKLGLILLISITGILLSISLPPAYSQLVSGNKYLLQATGFVAGKQTIQDSGIDLQFSTGQYNNGNTPVTLQNGLVTLSGTSYLDSGIWSSTLLRDGKFLAILGDAKIQTVTQFILIYLEGWLKTVKVALSITLQER